MAAGAILAMLSDTMIPEAFTEAHNLAGLITVLGFLLAFVLTKLQTLIAPHMPQRYVKVTLSCRSADVCWRLSVSGSRVIPATP